MGPEPEKCEVPPETAAVGQSEPCRCSCPPLRWCVHLLGPDSVLPTKTFQEAEQRALKINESLRALAKRHGWDEPEIHAVVELWPFSPESHHPEEVDWHGDLC